ncbi:MAG: sulfite reductase subunit beta, partial [Rickettsiales bacterium]
LPDYPVESAINAIAKSGLVPHFRFTGNQNLILLNVEESDKPKVQALLEQYGIEKAREALAPVETHALACVALNTCPLAQAEAQRYLPSLLVKIEDLLGKHGLAKTPISIRMTGCPNGCARPYVAEIGMVGRSMGHYNLHIGGDALGQRLNTLWKEDLDEAAILASLDGCFAEYAKERDADETFGDFAQRKYIKPLAA